MKIIAHRGLLDGPDKEKENSPDQILYALQSGYDCEIDLWFINESLYLGHDYAQYKINPEFLENKGLWIHAKNIEALYWLTNTNLVYFWHQNDDCVLTSNGYIWTNPEKPLTDKSIRLMPEWADPQLNTILNSHCAGICSDYANKIFNILSTVRGNGRPPICLR